MTLVITQGWALLFKAGPMVWVILFLMVAFLIVAVERLMAVIQYRREFINQRMALWALIKEGKMKEAMQYCDQRPGILTEMVKVGVLNIDVNKNIWNSLWQQVAVVSFNRIKTPVHLIGVVANVAPLLGILSTMMALVVIYHAAYMRANALNPLTLGDMASGIWQALVASCLGVLTGILLGVLHQYLMQMIHDLEDEMKAFMVHSLGVLTHEAIE